MLTRQLEVADPDGQLGGRIMIGAAGGEVDDEADLARTARHHGVERRPPRLRRQVRRVLGRQRCLDRAEATHAHAEVTLWTVEPPVRDWTIGRRWRHNGRRGEERRSQLWRAWWISLLQAVIIVQGDDLC